MAPKKKVSALIKLQIQAGKANPAPPLGPALGSHGVNIMDFCKAYNAQTQDKMGQVIPVEITVYEDRSFTFVLKTPPAAALLKKAAGVEKGTPPLFLLRKPIRICPRQGLHQPGFPMINMPRRADYNMSFHTAQLP